MKYLKLLLIAALALSGVGDAFAYNVYVRSNDAAYQSVDIDKIVLNADHSALLFFKNGTSENVPASEFVGILLTMPESGVEATEAELTGLAFEGGYILCPGSLAISDIEGRVCASSVDGRIYVGNLRPGVYVISNGNKSTKILLR